MIVKNVILKDYYRHHDHHDHHDHHHGHHDHHYHDQDVVIDGP